MFVNRGMLEGNGLVQPGILSWQGRNNSNIQVANFFLKAIKIMHNY